MTTVISVPTVDVPVVTLARICRMKKNRNGVFVREEIDALVWDPTAVRALLDEKIYRNPTAALLDERVYRNPTAALLAKQENT